MAPRKTALAGLNLALLASIADATRSNAPGYLFVSDADAKPLLDKGYIVQNTDASGLNEKGERMTKATDEGLAFSDANKPGATPPASVAAEVNVAAETSTPAFKIFKGVELPPVKRGGGNVGNSIYPFDTMEVKDAFFVAATAKRPEPAKSLASTVSGATRRFAVQEGTKTNKKGATVPNMKPTKKFKIQAVEDGAPFEQPGVAGAVITRVA